MKQSPLINKMKIGSIDNQIIIYLEGGKDSEKLASILKKTKIKGLPTKELADLISDNTNCIPTVGAWQDETDDDNHLVPFYRTKEYVSMVADFHREWIKKGKKEGSVCGTKEQKEYAARSAAYTRARPKGVDWTKPGSIHIPRDIKEEYGLLKKKK